MFRLPQNETVHDAAKKTGATHIATRTRDGHKEPAFQDYDSDFSDVSGYYFDLDQWTFEAL